MAHSGSQTLIRPVSEKTQISIAANVVDTLHDVHGVYLLLLIS